MNRKTKAGGNVPAENDAPTDERVENENVNNEPAEQEGDEPKKEAKANPPAPPSPEKNASADEAKRVTAIIEICTIAGCADKAMSFIQKGASSEDVRKALLAEKAKKTDANTLGTIVPSAEAAPAGNYGWDAIVDKLKAGRDKHLPTAR